jgi:hypothetical protein
MLHIISDKLQNLDYKSLILSLLKDIRFWIIFFALLRLYGITNPPLEISHAWRQTTVAMAARNFYEIDPNILYPRIDISEDLTGITGMEFPLLNYLIYLLSLVFGYADWYGRLINLIVTSIGCWFGYKLLRKYFSEQVSFLSTFVLIVSLWFPFARKIMPDTFAMSLVIMGIYFGTNYLEQQTRQIFNLLMYALLTLAGLLSKLPSGYILAVFAIPIFNKAISIKRKILFCAVSATICAPVAWWYFYWVPHLVSEFGLWHFFMGKGIAEGAREVAANMGGTLKHFYDFALKYVGFFVFLGGLILSIIRKERLLLTIIGLTFTTFLVVILKSGWTFVHHNYYILPFVPIMALFAGYALATIGKKKIQLLLLSAIALENVLNSHTDFIIKDKRKPIAQIENVLNRFSAPTDRIVINSGYDPTPMYYAHRKGWVATNEQLANESFLANLRQHGCKYVVILKHDLGEYLKMNLEVITDNDTYTVYRL